MAPAFPMPSFEPAGFNIPVDAAPAPVDRPAMTPGGAAPSVDAVTAVGDCELLPAKTGIDETIGC